MGSESSRHLCRRWHALTERKGGPKGRRLRPLPPRGPGRTEPTFASRCCNGGARGARPGEGVVVAIESCAVRDDPDATSPTRPPQEVAQTKDGDAAAANLPQGATGRPGG